VEDIEKFNKIEEKVMKTVGKTRTKNIENK
jgi:hypothetical protein